jgi:HPt (histidine-containing phosphotransfer) domain-containing protein
MTIGARATPHLGTEGSPAIDRSVLGEWLAGDDAAIDELLTVFRDSALTEQGKMSEALALGDLDEYANAAHRLRGAALAMGARMLAELAGTLYAAARTKDATACAGGMALLETDIRLMTDEVPAATRVREDRLPSDA